MHCAQFTQQQKDRDGLWSNSARCLVFCALLEGTSGMSKEEGKNNLYLLFPPLLHDSKCHFSKNSSSLTPRRPGAASQWGVQECKVHDASEALLITGMKPAELASQPVELCCHSALCIPAEYKSLIHTKTDWQEAHTLMSLKPSWTTDDIFCFSCHICPVTHSLSPPLPLFNTASEEEWKSLVW